MSDRKSTPPSAQHLRLHCIGHSLSISQMICHYATQYECQHFFLLDLYHATAGLHTAETVTPRSILQPDATTNRSLPLKQVGTHLTFFNRSDLHTVDLPSTLTHVATVSCAAAKPRERAAKHVKIPQYVVYYLNENVSRTASSRHDQVSGLSHTGQWSLPKSYDLCKNCVCSPLRQIPFVC